MTHGGGIWYLVPPMVVLSLSVVFVLHTYRHLEDALPVLPVHAPTAATYLAGTLGAAFLSHHVSRFGVRFGRWVYVASNCSPAVDSLLCGPVTAAGYAMGPFVGVALLGLVHGTLSRPTTSRRVRLEESVPDSVYHVGVLDSEDRVIDRDMNRSQLVDELVRDLSSRTDEDLDGATVRVSATVEPTDHKERTNP